MAVTVRFVIEVDFLTFISSKGLLFLYPSMRSLDGRRSSYKSFVRRLENRHSRNRELCIQDRLLNQLFLARL